MKPHLAILALLLCGCASTKLFDPQTGRVIARFESNIATGEYSAGGTTFRWTTMNNSVPTSAAYRGAGKLASTLGSDAVAVLVPGSGVAPVVGRAAIATSPHIFTAKPGD